MNCNCLTEIENKLKSDNLKLDGTHLGFTFPEFKLAIYLNLQYIDKNLAPKGKKNRAPKLLVSHCPFCGEKQTVEKSPEIVTAKPENPL